MKNPSTPKDRPVIDKIVDKALEDIASYDIADDENLPQALKNVTVLLEIQEGKKPEPLIPKDTLVKFLLLAGLTTAQIIIMLYFEQAGVITSKTLGFLQKIKVPSLL